MLRAADGVILCATALLVLGVVMVSSAGLSVEPGAAVGLGDVLLGRTALLAALALAAMLAASRLPPAGLERLLGRPAMIWLPLGAIVLLLMAVHVPGLGREVNGARRWIDLGFVGFQPSEVAKWALPALLAAYAARRAAVLDRPVPGLVLPMLPVGLICVLVGSEDLGTAVLIGAVAVAVLVAAGARLRHAALLAAPAAAGFVAAIAASPYRLDRLRAFLDPYRDPQGIGYHVIQSMATVAGGGLAGRGLGNSVQKFGYLPEDTTDFVFAIVCEELGLAGAAAVVCLFGALLWCGWTVVSTAGSPFARLLGLGILLTLGLQALINLAVVTGLAPTKGIALPLVSAGGTGWVLTAFSAGLLAAMGRDRESAKEPWEAPDITSS